MMVRPHHFAINGDTAADNEFQRTPAPNEPGCDISRRATLEFDAAVHVLRSAGITVVTFEDGVGETPDSVFPNNWVSTHSDGRIALYPLRSPRRRAERRQEVVDGLRTNYYVREVIDYSRYEQDQQFLEGTGAMVFDYVDRVAYVSLSKRADRHLASVFCDDFGFDPIFFSTAGASGIPIYHTNVMMSVATEFALVGLDLITQPADRAAVCLRLAAAGKLVIELTKQQVAHFAGNVIELQGTKGRVLVMSKTAYGSLRKDQIEQINTFATPIQLEIPTIELSGGSARCMIAAIHLPQISSVHDSESLRNTISRVGERMDVVQ